MQNRRRCNAAGLEYRSQRRVANKTVLVILLLTRSVQEVVGGGTRALMQLGQAEARAGRGCRQGTRMLGLGSKGLGNKRDWARVQWFKV